MVFFFFNDTATTEIYTLSLHDALPISRLVPEAARLVPEAARLVPEAARVVPEPARVAPGSLRPARPDCRLRFPSDRKSTRLNSSHSQISYAVFCLKKKKRTGAVNPDRA